jgi:hypothetical protein
MDSFSEGSITLDGEMLLQVEAKVGLSSLVMNHVNICMVGSASIGSAFDIARVLLAITSF